MQKNRKQIVRGVTGVVFLVIAPGITSAEGPQVAFPDNYLSWRHVKSMVIGPEHPSFAKEGGRIYEFYANQQAVEGYRAGKFANGSVIVRETLRAIAGEGELKGILKEGERTALDVMVKDARLYEETGGWGFETFDSQNGRLAEKARNQCYACHSKQKDHDFVFGTLRADAETGTPYPEGYRHWTFLHSLMVPPTFGGFANKPCEKPCMAGLFHFYANDKAMEGLRTGLYPDGAIIAEELLEWISTANGGAKEGQRRGVGVMVRDSQRYASTGGWGYGTYGDGSRTDKLDAKQRQACYQCHVGRKDHGDVFTEYRER